MRKTTLFTAILLLSFATAPLMEAKAEGKIKEWFESLFSKKEQIVPAQHPDLSSLTIDENIEIPEIPSKQVAQVRDIQKGEVKRLKAVKGYEVETLRNGEVIVVTLSAASLFAPNDTTLLAGADALLRPILPCLRTPDYYHVLLVMHSDNTGNDAYTYALTTKRVLDVFDWFERNGAVIDYLVPYAAGSHEPLQPNNSVENRNRNRRLEIYLIPGEAMFAKRK